MAGTHVHFICFLYIFMLDVHIFFRIMSTALKKNLLLSSLMKLCHAEARKYRPKSGNTTTSDLWTS